MNTYATADRLAREYGVQETNPMPDGGYAPVQDFITMRELQDRGGKLTVVRMLTEPGTPFLDVSYVRGALPDGTPVSIIGLQVGTLRKAKGSVPQMRDMIQWAKDEEVYGKGIGLLDQGIWSILH